MAEDERWMAQALRHAEEGLGVCFPNPSVGCVIVDGEGRLLGASRTADGGRPHAETQAIAQAVEALQKKTAGHARTKALADCCLYVTLEPCSHRGQTPPCVEAILRSGLRRVVVGAKDPDPRVSGAGIAFLRKAGLEVRKGVLEAQARALLSGYYHRLEDHRPAVTLKAAVSLDGKTALADGRSFWITGESARVAAHQLRRRHDGVMVGISTVLADDPKLSIRLGGGETYPAARIVMDGGARLPLNSHLVQTASLGRVIVLTAPQAPARPDLEAKGVGLVRVTAGAGGLCLKESLAFLAEEGFMSLLVEGGTSLRTSFLKEGLADCLALFTAPCLMGGESYDLFGSLGYTAMESVLRLKVPKEGVYGADCFKILRFS